MIFNFNPHDFAISFLSVLLEGLPFVLLGAFISGLVDAYLPAGLLGRVLPRNPVASVLIGGAMGLLLPMCECGVVPVVRRLIHKGLPLSCALAYMLAAPVVSPIVIISTLAAFKGNDPWTMLFFRLGLSYLVAVFVALVCHHLPAHWILRPEILPSPFASAKPAPVRSSAAAAAAAPFLPPHLAHAIQSTVRDFLDITTYLVIGAALSSLFNTSVNQAVLAPLATNLPLSIAALMGLAFSLALCSTSDAFIAATLTAFPVAAKLAFLVFGPMMDIKLIFLYTTAFRRPFVIALAVGLFVLVGLACLQVAPLLGSK